MFNLEQLLHPVSAVSPCGGDITFSQELDAIARARQHDDPSLDQGEWVTALKEADWPFVATRCEQLIASHSKDLRVAVWLAEAHAKTRHFRGLGDGYALLAGGELPTVRTALMIGLIALARSGRRPLGAVQGLALAALALLLPAPLSVLSAGFWLSFGGVLWLVWCLPQGRPRGMAANLRVPGRTGGGQRRPVAAGYRLVRWHRLAGAAGEPAGHSMVDPAGGAAVAAGHRPAGAA